MTPVERSTSTPPPLRMRVGKPGDGARLKPLWLPWLGNHFDEAMDSLDQGTMLTSGGFLELVLVAEDRSSGDVVGMLLPVRRTTSSRRTRPRCAPWWHNWS